MMSDMPMKIAAVLTMIMIVLAVAVVIAQVVHGLNLG